VRIYTGLGDDGSTGRLFGGRVTKDSALMEFIGAVDEAVALLGLARAAAGVTSTGVARRLLTVQRGLFVAAADVVANPSSRDRLLPGVSLVTEKMVVDVEQAIDELTAERPQQNAFVVPGGTPESAALDVARTAVRRAERRLVTVARADDTPVSAAVLRYVNRVSDLLYVLARHSVPGDEELSHEMAG
jgi:cob(I)alamin adenosyltransferase